MDLVAIGASTGGPNALALLFSRLPANFPVPIVVVQHMPAEFTPHLAERLSRESNLPVREAHDGARLLPGEAWVAPGGRHTVVVAGLPTATLALNADAPVHSCRPSVDVLLHSVRKVYGDRALAVVMTGMGEDGLDGARELKAAGGSVLAQDEESSVVWGMAGAVANAGLAEAVLPVTELGDEIVAAGTRGPRLNMLEPQDFLFVRDLIRAESGMVLADGKEYLVEARLRGLSRREGLSGLSELVRRLRGGQDPELAARVVESVLIGETYFFRDVHPFEALRDTVLPELIRARAAQRALNVWCAATSTGQEVYSLALLIADAFPQLAGWRVHILGTDFSEHMLERTREGRYSEAEIGRGLPEAMRERYFRREGDTWVLDRSIRNRVELRRLNLIRDWPPLPPMDLVLLRNVLIYFDGETRETILRHVEALVRPGGFLVLGTSETLLVGSEGFDQVRLGRSICYRRRPRASRPS